MTARPHLDHVFILDFISQWYWGSTVRWARSYS